ncbi:DsbA family protein [Agarivorans gilvus]|uniref:DsbA family protein n=1 Tax=Agarivorans gilvus TaxID=680279 RepID=A0ABQ1HUT2_9ALTE|nr:DsbA family protein [Agarivorans gilvus]GGA92625.1 DsbA family protein [Agarivorans gilvus]
MALVYYVHDPMCSWCWGYKPRLAELEQALPPGVDLVYLLGGLAADTEQPMPQEMQQFLQQTWRKIALQLGTQFNHDFWHLNSPKRSTYPANRAVLAAEKQAAGKAMISAIQQAYYLQAKNPSEFEVLVALAEQLNLDKQQFIADMQSEALNQQLMEQIEFARSLPIQGFPSLVLSQHGQQQALPLDYLDAQVTLEHLARLMA